MQRAAFGFILAMASTVVHGGYDEFTILDFAGCKSYTLTSDWGDAEFSSKEAKQQFERDRAIAGFGSDGQIYALLGELDEPASFAGCDYQASHIECKRIGNFPYAVLKCPFGKSRSAPWVRTCQVNTGSSASVRMYWVDTSENEDGSVRVDSQFLVADFKRYSAKCKRRV